MKKVFLCLLSALLIGCSSIAVNAEENKTALIPPAVSHTISDATYIQMVLAGIKTVDENMLWIYDVDYDGKLTVNDVTLIQKEIAGCHALGYSLVEGSTSPNGYKP